jgi:hypothetical protein
MAATWGDEVNIDRPFKNCSKNPLHNFARRASQFLAAFWTGAIFYPLAPRQRGEGQGEGIVCLLSPEKNLTKGKRRPGQRGERNFFKSSYLRFLRLLLLNIWVRL